jgi:nitrile hydratase subunit alpha
MTAYDPHRAAEDHDEIHAHVPSEPALRVKALESLLVEKGLVDSGAIDAWIEIYRDQVGPKLGARVVARAWNDAAYKARLLADGTAAIKELGIEGWAGGHLKVVENTDQVYNLVVCTGCSCYPHAVLGMQPSWYKKEAYRSRAVREPRAVLAEFGVKLPDHVAVNVWDSTAELRYLVLPQRPAGTEGWAEDKLAALVTGSAGSSPRPITSSSDWIRKLHLPLPPVNLSIPNRVRWLRSSSPKLSVCISACLPSSLR